MNDNAALDRLIASVMADQAAPGEADQAIDQILTITRRIRPQPRWLVLLKEPSMRMNSQVVAGSPPVRLGLLLGLVILLAVTGAAIVGASLLRSSKPTLAPFGPAANGTLVHEVSGNIVVTNADGTGSRILIDGPGDASPLFSRDGTMLLFDRFDGMHALTVAAADGSRVRELAGDRLEVMGFDWSPNGEQAAILSQPATGDPMIEVVDVADAAPPRRLDLGGIVPADWVFFRPPGGSELVFNGHPAADSPEMAVYRVPVAGGKVERVSALATSSSPGGGVYASGSLSPDGRWLTTWTWGPNEAGEISSWGHVLDLSTSEERTATDWGGSLSPISPDGRFVAGAGDGVVIDPIDGSSASRNIPLSIPGNEWAGITWSPDGRQILVTQTDKRTFIVDVAQGTVTETPERIPTLPTWQRIAP